MATKEQELIIKIKAQADQATKDIKNLTKEIETALLGIVDTIDVWAEAIDGLLNAQDELFGAQVGYQNLANQVDTFTGTAEDFEMLKRAMKKAKEEGQKELQTELEKERQEKHELQTSLENFRQANTKMKLDQEVSKVFKEFDVVENSRDAIEFMLRSRVSMNDKGEIVYSDGETEAGLKDGFAKYFEQHPMQLNAKGNPEGGSGAGHQGSSGGAQKKSFGGSKEERQGAIAEMIASGQN